MRCWLLVKQAGPVVPLEAKRQGPEQASKQASCGGKLGSFDFFFCLVLNAFECGKGGVRVRVRTECGSPGHVSSSSSSLGDVMMSVSRFGGVCCRFLFCRLVFLSASVLSEAWGSLPRPGECYCVCLIRTPPGCLSC